MNKPRTKGTLAENAVVQFLREHGWSSAERRALSGSQDKGDIAGCPGLAWEVKFANYGLKLGPWLTETGMERLNAGADHGILVVKPLGMGEKSVASWYAVMVASDFTKLQGVAGVNVTRQFYNSSFVPLFVVDGPATTYTAATLRWSLNAGTKQNVLAPNEVLALTLRPPGTKDRPERWYRVMTLAHMVRLLHVAGYGDREYGIDPVWETMAGPVQKSFEATD